MNKLLEYLNSLSSTERAAYCERCNTSESYLRKAISIGQALGESLCVSLERESKRAVTCEELRPDVDWRYYEGWARSRSLKKRAHA